MNRTALESALNGVEERWISEAETYHRTTKRRRYVLSAVAAACLIFTAGALALREHFRNPIPQTPFTPNLELTERTTAAVRPVSKIETSKVAAASKGELIDLTEEELFSDPRMIAFRGTVVQTQNYEISFGTHKNYRCVAQIRADKIYRGDIREGTIVSVLLPCPIGLDGYAAEDMGIVQNIRVGSEGIFMPYRYSDGSCWGEENAVVMLRELAMCGLGDGVRHVFLLREHEIVYARSAYPSATEISTLDDAEAYVTAMLNRYQPDGEE